MNFIATPLDGAYVIEPERFVDDRGFFARTWCQREFTAQGLSGQLVQANISCSHKAGTLRGMHYQIPPYSEDKLVRVTCGRIYDVIVDIRPRSRTFLRWFGVELTAENRLSLYVPKGFAHGFQTLADYTEVFYQMSEFYVPEYAGGARWDDPSFGIAWPAAVSVISARDARYADATSETFAAFASLT